MPAIFTRRECAIGLPFIAVLALLSGPAAAQSAGAGLEEITVTARKMEESLQETPVSVTALTGDDLAARGIASLDEIAHHAPNVEFFSSGISGRSSGQAYIRGIGQFDYLLTTDPGVGIYLDGVYLARSLGNLLELVDIERVEILRGPQGTLYGKNTVGGAINVITRKPTDELEGAVEVKTGSYDRLNARGSVSGPLAPGLRGRLALSTRNADGFGRRPLAGDRAGEEESNAAQAVLLWEPADSFEMVLAADYTRANETFSHHHTEALNPAAPLVGLYNALAGPLAPLHGLALPPYDARWLTTDAFVDNSTDGNFNDQEIWGVSATMTWEVGGVTVKSITGYREMDVVFGTDPDGSPARIVDETDFNTQEQVSQELQLSGSSFDGRLDWVVGAYYLSEDASADMTVRAYEGLFQALERLPAALIPLGPGVVCPAPLPAPCAGGPGNPVNIGLDVGRFTTLDQDTESFSIYGQGSFAITDRLSLTYGLRYTDEEKDFAYSLTQLQSGNPQVPLSEVGDSWSDVSHRAGLDYHWTADFMTYFSAARGFKSGGFNGRGRTANEIQSYDPETVWSYEAGWKSEWFDRRLRLNGAVFYNDYSDMQFTLSTSDPSGAQVIIVGNAAAADITGFELEALASPVEQLELSASVGYLDAEYSKVDPGTGITEDHKLIATPEWTATVGAEYTIPLGAPGLLRLRADYSYRSKTWFDVVNTAAVAQEGYGLLNLRATLESTDGHWTLSGGVTNVTDEAYKAMGVGVLDSLGFASAVYGRPREWFLQAGYRY
jgi:iron complex outermembrane receptor protein